MNRQLQTALTSCGYRHAQLWKLDWCQRAKQWHCWLKPNRNLSWIKAYVGIGYKRFPLQARLEAHCTVYIISEQLGSAKKAFTSYITHGLMWWCSTSRSWSLYMHWLDWSSDAQMLSAWMLFCCDSMKCTESCARRVALLTLISPFRMSKVIQKGLQYAYNTGRNCQKLSVIRNTQLWNQRLCHGCKKKGRSKSSSLQQMHKRKWRILHKSPQSWSRPSRWVWQSRQECALKAKLSSNHTKWRTPGNICQVTLPK